MEQERPMSLEQIREFVAASQEIRFEGAKRKEVYDWARQVLTEQQYHLQGKAGRGLLRCYLAKTTGLSRAQVTRLIGQFPEDGEGGSSRVPQATLPQPVHEARHRTAS